MRFRRVNAFQTNAMLCVGGIQHRDRVAISDANDPAGEGLATGRRDGLRRRSLAFGLSGTANAEDRCESNQPNESGSARRVNLILPRQFFKEIRRRTTAKSIGAHA